MRDAKTRSDLLQLDIYTSLADIISLQQLLWDFARAFDNLIYSCVRGRGNHCRRLLCRYRELNHWLLDDLLRRVHQKRNSAIRDHGRFDRK